MRPEETRTVYYTDLLHDDFADNGIHTEDIPPDYPFVRSSLFYRIGAFLLYYLIALPIVYLICKLYLGLRIKNRRVIRRVKGSFFLYGNHTRALDAFLGPMVAAPRRAYILCSADAVSIPGLRTIVQMLGGIPIPASRAAMPPFLAAVAARLQQPAAMVIFPEAHIWPFCSFIRPFTDVSFRYPVTHGRPVIAMVTTYRRRTGLFRLCRRPGMTLTLSEPLYPDPALSPREARRDLRDRVYAFMCAHADAPDNVAYIRYERAE